MSQEPQAEPLRRCGACCEEMQRRYKEAPSKYKKRKYCSVACTAAVNSNRFLNKKRGGD